MKIRDIFRSWMPSGGQVRAQHGSGITVLDLNDPTLQEYLRGGAASATGAVVNLGSAMRVATAWRSTHLICGPCGNLPIDVYRRVNERERTPAVGHPLRELLTARPNSWQTPAEFRKMLTAHALNKGDGFALKITSVGRLIALWPLDDPDRMEVWQNDDMSLGYAYTTRKGRRVPLAQADVLHLRGITFDGIRGVGVLRAAREALGLSLTMERAGGRMFMNGVLAGGAVKMPDGHTLSDEAYKRLKADLEENNATAENAGKLLILEEGMDYASNMFSAEDLQFLESRKFSRTDVAMFYGVPPFLTGDTEKSTSWGTGLEQQGTGFVQYTLLDWFTMWEQSLARDCLTDADRSAGIFIKIDARGLMRGDFKNRTDGYAKGLGSGGSQPWMTVNEVRGLEDMPPIAGGDVLPPRASAPATPPKEDDDDPKPPAP